MLEVVCVLPALAFFRHVSNKHVRTRSEQAIQAGIVRQSIIMTVKFSIPARSWKREVTGFYPGNSAWEVLQQSPLEEPVESFLPKNEVRNPAGRKALLAENLLSNGSSLAFAPWYCF